jgi:ATP-binding cassette subfamily F protein 3
MRAKDVLLESLSKYSGTVVFVSHDRYFIDNLAARVFEIEDGHVHVYPGNYEDYLWRKAGGPEQIQAATVAAVVVPEPEPVAVGVDSKKRVNPMKLKKLQERLRAVEQEVASLESEIAQHDAALADFKSMEETLRISEIVAERRKRLEARVAEWESVSAELEGAG